MRVAAIDCGTNSIRLLIADIVAGKLSDVLRTMIIVRLGEGVDQTHEFSQAALTRTFSAVDVYAQLIFEHKPDLIRFVATSASRDVSNRADFFAGVKSRLGLEPTVISGDEEARLSFLGATKGLASSASTLEPPYLVIDIGGGSTEFVIGNTEPLRAISMDIGCVRMTERHLTQDPPTAEEVAAATLDIDAAIASADQQVHLSTAKTLIGVAGSVTTVAALALELAEYDSTKIHGSRVSATKVHEITSNLLRMTRSDRARLGAMHEGRVDVIGGGSLVLDRIMQATGLPEVIVSEHDILDGIAYDLVAD
ncbi:MAG: Ppx/GppA family phosphatase [Actinobacteria bacterium]|nr:Ppx/GppA family phosphatase [Actinomycetota bacterium]NBY15079.1 Ppx/GppA family phosphatase [Actinomycetota bacterium]